jgi:hypothetical protein
VLTESRALVIARFYQCAIHYSAPVKKVRQFAIMSHALLLLKSAGSAPTVPRDSADVITRKNLHLPYNTEW